MDEYLQLARTTIDTGTPFTFRTSARPRIGYYHLRSRRFVVLRDDGETILSLSRRSENHVRQLPDSTYGR